MDQVSLGRFVCLFPVPTTIPHPSSNPPTRIHTNILPSPRYIGDVAVGGGGGGSPFFLSETIGR
jgi:hypothetical protein